MPGSWKRAVRAAVVVTILAVSVAVLPAGGDSIAQLPPGFSAIATDPTNSNVYVSSATSGAVTVLDRDGRAIRTISGVAGAGEMVVAGGRLYVVASDAGRVEAYDTTTFEQVAVMGEDRLVAPGPLVFAAGLLWTSTGECGNWNTQLVSIDPATGRTTVHRWIDANDPLSTTTMFSYCLGLTADPSLGDRLLAFTPGLSPATFGRIDIVLGTPVVAQTSRSDVSNAREMAVLPGGERFVVAAGAPYQINRYRVSDLALDGTVYRTGYYPNAVAATAGGGGLLAAGRNDEYGDDVDLFDAASPAMPLWRRQLSQGSRLHTRGLTFNADGSRLYAVFDSDDRPNPFLAVMDADRIGLVSTRAYVDAPTFAANGQPSDVQVYVSAVSGTGVSVSGGLVDVFADDDFVGTASLTGNRGTLRWVPDREGSRRLWARYGGEGRFAPSVSSSDLVSVKAGASIALSSAANPSSWGDPVVVTAVLTSTAGLVPTGSVAFYEGATLLRWAALDSTGRAVYSGSLAPGSHSVTARYNGDSNHGPSAPATIVQAVERATTSTSVTSSANPAQKRDPVTFTASVTPPSAGGAAATGSVAFYDGTTLAATVALSNGVAQFTTDALEKGDHEISAVYAGDSLFAGSAAPVLVQTVK